MRTQFKTLLHALMLIAGCLLLAVTAMAQDVAVLSTAPDAVPQRGFYPEGSFSLSDIESVDNMSGNLILRFPIAKLPPGRAGSSFSVNLIYNSAIYDIGSQIVQVPEPGEPAIPAQQATYVPSPFGGWNYEYDYTLGWEQNLSTCIPIMFNFAMDICVNCNTLLPPPVAVYPFTPFIIMPDGSKHMLRMEGYSALGNPPGSWGTFPYNYAITPFGDQSPNVGIPNTSCAASTPVQFNPANPFVYVTDDGSSIRVETSPQNKTWTMFLPDGTVVKGNYLSTIVVTSALGYGPPVITGSVPTPTYYEQITDRNSNTITEQRSWTGANYRKTLTDDLGRSITIDYNYGTEGTDTITWPGNGVTLSASASWYLQRVLQQYQCLPSTVPASLMAPCYLPALEDVVSLVLPAAQSGGSQMNYTFSYCVGGNDTLDPSCAAKGYLSAWGELQTMQAFSSLGAAAPLYTVDYAYAYNVVYSMARNQGWLENPVWQKTLTYNETPGQPSTQQPPEVTSYRIGPFATWGGGATPTCPPTVITHPDGTASQYFYITRDNLLHTGGKFVRPGMQSSLRVMYTGASPGMERLLIRRGEQTRAPTLFQRRWDTWGVVVIQTSV